MTEKIDPVEVMARAIFAEQHPSLAFDLCRETTQSNYRSMARSALAAAEAAGMVMVERAKLLALSDQVENHAMFSSKDRVVSHVVAEIAAMIEAASLQEKP